VAAPSLLMTLDASQFQTAAEALSNLTIGPKPSRTNPTGDRRKVLDPRSIVAEKIVEVVDFVLASIRDLTPEGTGEVRRSYNVRRGFGEVRSKGTFNLVYEIASDLPDSRQVVVNALEFGSVPHEIKPVHADFLRFEIAAEDYAAEVPGREDGREVRTFVDFDGVRAVIYTTLVEHPGTQPHAMFRITAARALPIAQRIAREIARAVGASFVEVDPTRRTTS